MIAPPAGVRVWLAAGTTDMRRGFDGLASVVQQALGADPFSGHVFVFRGRRGHLVKVLWWDGQGLCLLSKRIDRGRFVWPAAKSGTVSLTAAQLSMLLEGIDWRRTAWTARPRKWRDADLRDGGAGVNDLGAPTWSAAAQPAWLTSLSRSRRVADVP